jgi:hypothetical protein
MEKIKLSENQKRLLRSLYEKKYPEVVPIEDFEDFNLLEVEGLVNAAHCRGMQGLSLHNPSITEKGLAYITSNPTLQNPSIWDDKKYVINTIISVIALLVAIIALCK